MTSVSLLLVELVSPDVMYNGLPWPDEDFTKAVIEFLIILCRYYIKFRVILNYFTS